jgi:hypothetical protein
VYLQSFSNKKIGSTDPPAVGVATLQTICGCLVGQARPGTLEAVDSTGPMTPAYRTAHDACLLLQSHPPPP